MVNRKLGRGLSALLGGKPPKSPSAPGVVELSIGEIRPNRWQPRSEVEGDALKGLSESIRVNGVLQPIIVRPHPEGGFELVVGERRWRAAMAAGLDKIPAVVRDIGDDKMLQLALLENIQREDLNAIERAKGYQRLIRDLGWTQEQAAERLGESRTSLANTLRLLELPEEIQQIVSRETISPGHARCLLVLRDPEAQKRLCQRIIKESLSVREVEDIVSGDRHQTAASRQAQRSAPHIRDIEERLQRVLGTKVQVRERGQRGRIIINFANHDDFERILAMIDREGGAGGFHV